MSLRHVILASMVLAVVAPLSAHHSYSDFDRDRTTSIEGTLQKVAFVNPHVTLTVRAKDGHSYELLWRAPRQLVLAGVAADALKVGDVIVASGSPALDPERRVLTLLDEVRRPRDGWRWRLQEGMTVDTGE
jgi:hypothetical protein